MTELVRYRREGDAAIVEMDDGKANALSEAMIDALLAALTRAEAEAGALVLTGSPPPARIASASTRWRSACRSRCWRWSSRATACTRPR